MDISYCAYQQNMCNFRAQSNNVPRQVNYRQTVNKGQDKDTFTRTTEKVMLVGGAAGLAIVICDFLLAKGQHIKAILAKCGLYKGKGSHSTGGHSTGGSTGSHSTGGSTGSHSTGGSTGSHSVPKFDASILEDAQRACSTYGKTLEEINRKMSSVKGANINKLSDEEFEILKGFFGFDNSVTKSNFVAQVNKKYKKLALSFHPDKHSADSDDVKGMYNTLFQILGQFKK